MFGKMAAEGRGSSSLRTEVSGSFPRPHVDYLASYQRRNREEERHVCSVFRAEVLVEVAFVVDFGFGGRTSLEDTEREF